MEVWGRTEATPGLSPHLVRGLSLPEVRIAWALFGFWGCLLPSSACPCGMDNRRDGGKGTNQRRSKGTVGAQCRVHHCPTLMPSPGPSGCLSRARFSDPRLCPGLQRHLGLFQGLFLSAISQFSPLNLTTQEPWGRSHVCLCWETKHFLSLFNIFQISGVRVLLLNAGWALAKRNTDSLQGPRVGWASQELKLY